MKLKGNKNTYDARVLSDTKVPKFVRGNYVTQNIKVDGKNVEFKYDDKRKTGLYFKMNGKNLYFAERGILKETTLSTKIEEAEKKATTKKSTPKKAAKAPAAEASIAPIEG